MKNKKGFTLIELLAVIVIMGVLMWGAVTAYGRIMENSKRDVFVTTTAAYVEAISNYKLADALNCGSNSFDSNKKFVFYIATDTSAVDSSVTDGSAIVTQTLKLMEKGGKSSWSNADVFGYVAFQKNGEVTQYEVSLNDTSGNGTWASDSSTVISSPSQVDKNHVKAGATSTTKLMKLTDSNIVECTLAG